MKKALYILNNDACDRIYGPSERDDIAQLVDVIAPPLARESLAQRPELLSEVQIILSGWGGPCMDEAFLEKTPQLEAVFYGAGSIRRITPAPFWDRNIVICSAWGMNAIPVAEYTLSQILFCLKRGWQFARAMRELRGRPSRSNIIGAFGSTVGLVSLGMVGRAVCKLLSHHDLQIVAYDPFTSPQQAADLGVSLCGLDEVFQRADVVSLHTPLLDETRGMIRGEHFRMMKAGATFINTARGAVVREEEMIAVLKERPDLFAVLDVTYPEPPVPDSPLYTLPNVVLTPHIAGALGDECRRMGREMVVELQRYLTGQKLQWAISREQALHLA